MTATEIEREYESREIEILPSQLQTDDYHIATGTKVGGKPKVGTKWVTVAHQAGGDVKFVKGEKIMVQRKFETQASRERRSRADKNEWFEAFIEKWEPTLPKALEAHNTKALEWGRLSWDHLGSLVAADAEDHAKRQIVEAMKFQLRPDAEEKIDAAEAYDRAIQGMKDRVIGMVRGTSRSTSMLSNLLEDARLEAMASLCEGKLHWLL